MDLLMEAPSAEKTYSAPKVQAPTAKPLPSTPDPGFPTPQFKYATPIEANINTSDIICRVLAKKVCLSVEELLPLAPKVRRHFKDLTMTKRLPELPAEAHAAAHSVSTFATNVCHEHFSAETTLPLGRIEVTLDHTIMVMGIIDSGCQVVIIHRDIWERLGAPLKHDQVMFMESANRQSNATMGTIPSICFSIGEVSLYFLVQVVKEAPFECLLSLPFTSLASTRCQEFLDGSAHLILTDPNSGASITVPTHAKQSPRCRPPPCSHEEDF